MAGLTTVETGVAALLATGKMSQQRYDLAIQQIAQLRLEVMDSATMPVSWSDIYQRVLNLAVAWLPAPQAAPPAK